MATRAGSRIGTPTLRVAVRAMRPADVAQVARIERAVFGLDAWPAGAFSYACHVFAASRPPRGALWVATAAGTVVGYAGIELSALGGEADLVNLAVTTAWRRRGVGEALLAAAGAYCRRRRVPLLWLRVRAGNHGARRFYHRCGYRVVGRFRGYYGQPTEDAVLMAWPETPPRVPRRRDPAGGQAVSETAPDHLPPITTTLARVTISSTRVLTTASAATGAPGAAARRPRRG